MKTKTLSLIFGVSLSLAINAQVKSNKPQVKTTTNKAQKKDASVRLGSYTNSLNAEEECLVTINIEKNNNIYNYSILFKGIEEKGVLIVTEINNEIYLKFKTFEAQYDKSSELSKILIQNYNNNDEKVNFKGCNEKFLELIYQL